MIQLLTDIHRPDAFTQPREGKEERSGACLEENPAFCPHCFKEQDGGLHCFPRLWDGDSSSFPREAGQQLP